MIKALNMASLASDRARCDLFNGLFGLRNVSIVVTYFFGDWLELQLHNPTFYYFFFPFKRLRASHLLEGVIDTKYKSQLDEFKVNRRRPE